MNLGFIYDGKEVVYWNIKIHDQSCKILKTQGLQFFKITAHDVHSVIGCKGGLISPYKISKSFSMFYEYEL